MYYNARMGTSTVITSRQNPLVQRLRKLLRDGKTRRAEGRFVLEGVRLVEEALQTGWPLEMLIHRPDLSGRAQTLVAACQVRGIDVQAVSDDVLASVEDTGHGQGVIAIAIQQELALPERIDLAIAVDELRDPGNLGTILRSAAAAGAQAAWLTPGCVDAFSPKVLRSGMGAQLRLPVETLAWPEIHARAERYGLFTCLAEAQAHTPLWQADLTRPALLAIGGEAEGFSAQAGAGMVQRLAIPMPGETESLNAAVAASILLYECVRQRAARREPR